MADLDEAAADDGALHRLYAEVPLSAIVRALASLRYLAAVRGPVTDEQRARARALADDPAFPLGHHPVVARILEAP